MRTSLAAALLLASGFALGGSGPLRIQSAFARVEVPEFQQLIVDQAKALSPLELQSLQMQLSILAGQVRIPMEVWILPAAQGEPLDALAQRAFSKFKLSRKGDERSVLYLVVMRPYGSRLLVGAALKAALPASYVKELLAEVAPPAFRNGRYAEITKVLTSVSYKARTLAPAPALSPPAAAAAPAPTPTPPPRPVEPNPLFYVVFIVPLLFFGLVFWATLKWSNRAGSGR